MKNKYLVNQLLVLVAIFSLSFYSCLEDDCSERQFFVEFEAIYVQPNEFRVDVETLPARSMENTGKIYFYNNLIFINELYTGVHIIDNSDPSAPQNIAFLSIPGNLDVAIKGNTMYADNYVDLLSIDITDIQNPVITCRDEEVFKTYNYFDALGYFIYNKPTDRQMAVNCNDPNFGDRSFFRNDVLFIENILVDASGPGFMDSNGNSIETGQAGSLAKMALVSDHLYVINNSELTAFNLSNIAKPVETQTTNVTWNIETIFPYKNHLFIGANNGLFIYDINNPEAPQYVSKFQHAQACDPVFVKDDIAYVTLRDGTACQNFINQIDIINVKDIRNPSLMASFDMDHPHGLTLRGDFLYLCEGKHGLKVFRTDDLEHLDKNKVDHVKNINAKDAISLSPNHLLVIGDGGLYQFNTTDPTDIKQISYLSVSK